MSGKDRSVDRLELDALTWTGLGLVLFGLTLALFNLTSRSLWWDELFTMALASAETSGADAAEQISADVHPPLYFWGARMWMLLWSSTSDFTLRLFNLVPYAIAALAAFQTLSRTRDKGLTLWAILFFTSFGTLWYLQEARMYAMLIASAFMACLVVMEFRDKVNTPLTPAYAVLTSLGFVILPFGHWFSLAFCGLILIGLCVWALRLGARSYLILFFTQGAVLGLAGVIWILMNMDNTLGGVGGYGEHIYGGAITLWGVRLSTTGTLLFTLSLNPILIAAALYGAVHIARTRQQLPEFGIILGASGVLFVSIYAVSIFAPMYPPRNFTWLIPVLTLLASVGLKRAFDQIDFSNARRAASLLVISAVSATIGWVFITADSVSKTFRLEQDEWRQAGQYVSNVPGCENSVIPVSTQWLTPRHAPDSIAMKYSKKLYDHYLKEGVEARVIIPGKDTVQIGQTDCSVVLWIGQVGPVESETIAADVLGPDFNNQTRRQTFQGHVVLIADKPENL
nr:hypothetical protein [Hyphomonas sp. Mor2]